MRPHLAITLAVTVLVTACAGAPSSPSRTASASGDAESADSAAERPGLGTVWGETVRSRVENAPFSRASRSPFAAVAVHYNDDDGVLAQARYLGDREPWYARTSDGGVSVALADSDGQLLPGGEVAGRNLVVGRDGERYTIVIVNHTVGRYEVVASVDGLDVIDGRPADPAKRGYILDPEATLTIDGFRRSDDAVAAFRFGRVADSYAARTAGDRNVGVIGVALFAERGSRWTDDELHRRDTADPFPGDPSYAQPPRY